MRVLQHLERSRAMKAFEMIDCIGVSVAYTEDLDFSSRGYGATAARLTPDQKVGSSNLSALKDFSAAASGLGHTTLPGDVAAGPCHTGIAAVFRARGGGSNPPPPTPNLFVVGKPCPQPRRLLPGTVNRLPLARAWPPGRSMCCNCQGQ